MKITGKQTSSGVNRSKAPKAVGKKSDPKKTAPREENPDQVALNQTRRKHKPLFLSNPRYSGEQNASGAPANQWTVFYYASAGDSLEEIRVAKLLELELIGSTPQMNLLAQIDRGEEHLTIREHGGKAGATRYKLEKTNDMKHITSPEIEHFGQVNASDPKVFQDFLEWGMKEYPAKHYLIMVQGHGEGANGLLRDSGKEAKAENHQLMSIPEFAGAIKNAEEKAGVDKDRVVLDVRSCMMGTAELAYELKDSASMLVDSQATTYAQYWRINDILGPGSVPTMGPEGMARHIAAIDSIDSGTAPRMATHSLIDLKQAPELKKAVTEFQKAVKASPEDKARVKDALEVTSRPNFHEDTEVSFFASDFYDAAHTLAGDKGLQSPQLRKAAQNLEKTLDKLIVQHGKWESSPAFNKNANGMGISTASQPDFYQQIGYGELAFDKDTGWSEFMTGYLAGDEEEQLGRLNDALQESPRLTEIARKAEETLSKPEELKNDCDRAREKIAQAKADQRFTPGEKGRECLDAVKGMPVFMRFEQLKNKPCFRSEGDRPERVEDTPVKKTLTAFLGEVSIYAASQPPMMEEIIGSGLTILSALEGEISAKTLASAAKKLLEPGESQNPELMVRLQADFLSVLAKVTRNDKAIAALNRGGLDAKKQLQALAGMEKAG